MAEAHSAVAFSFSITHEGWDVNFDREVLHLVWQSGIRSWKKRFFRFVNNLRSGVYPASLESLWFTIAVVTAIHFAGFKVPYDLVGKTAPYLSASSVLAHLAGSFIIGLLLWLIVIYVIRYTFKLLLMYKGWMYESREKGCSASRITKTWTTLVKLFFGWHKPMLYSFQGSLPRLPLPSVVDTMKRYLRSVRPLLDDENYARMETLANEFQKGIGVKLQRYLILKSWWATNYVSDWWEEYVYLRGRSPIMVNSNFYGIDAILMYPTNVQVARAANVIYSCLQYRRLIERQELEPILIQGLVPLCSWQYERVFNTTRIPGRETDKIVHYQDSKHIVVYHKGKYFKVPIYHKNRILQPSEIEIQMQQILNDKSIPSDGEEKLAALTASERTAWAIAREEFFSKGMNKASLDLIEKAAFIVVLDDIPYIYDPEDPDKLDEYGRILFGCRPNWTLYINSEPRLCGRTASVFVRYWREIVRYRSLIVIINYKPTPSDDFFYEETGDTCENFENRFDLHFKDKLLTDISVDSVFELIRDIKDPEHPYTLEELNVVRKDLIKIYQLKDEYVVEDIINCIEVQFEPTIPHCSMAAIIGLIIKILLEKYIKGYYIIVSILEGSHVNDKMLNKQLKDKDRVQAASENEALLEIIDECLVSIIDKYDL